MKTPQSSKIHVQIPPEMVQKVDECAKALYLSRSDYIRLALAEKMRRDPLPTSLMTEEQRQHYFAMRADLSV